MLRILLYAPFWNISLELKSRWQSEAGSGVGYPSPNIGWRLFPLELHAHGYPVSHRPGKQRRNSPSKTSPTGAQTGMQSVIPHFAMTNWSGETRANRPWIDQLVEERVAINGDQLVQNFLRAGELALRNEQNARGTKRNAPAN